MSNGKPEFFEGYANPDATYESVVDFDYAAIDGEIQGETELRIIADAVVRILAELTAGRPHLSGHEYVRTVAGRTMEVGFKVGLWFGSTDVRWLQGYVRTNREAYRLGMALRKLFGTILDGNAQLSTYSGQIGTRTIALAWIIAPSLFGGTSLKVLAEHIGIHAVTLSSYTADISRAFGVRSHAQSKGWNFNPDKKQKAKKRPKKGF
jgi:hypothetical protein